MPVSSERCSACGSEELRTFFDASAVPVLVCVLWPDAEAARACPRGDVRLTFCGRCGLVENQAYDPRRVEYTEGYENALTFSEFFQGYLRDFAEAVIERHGLRGKRVVEIGSGDGEFLALLCELGGNEGIGFDPSYPTDLPDTRAGGRVRFVREAYSPAQADLGADLIACRQVLEHVPDPVPFLISVRESLGERTDAAVVFEVPNTMFTLEQLSLWDVVYEHCTYFTRGSLARLFAATGFDVVGASETYARQFLAVDAVPSRGARGSIATPVEDVSELAEQVDRFAAAYLARIVAWRSELERARDAGRTVALWGTGARGVNFLNLSDPTGVIQHVVDINPRKHGMHVAGTGQRISPPGSLRDVLPDEVIVMNPNYLPEITKSLREMGLDPAVRRA